MITYVLIFLPRCSHRSISFSTECLGFHLGTPQTANLGDGRGAQNEIAVMREDFKSVRMGTCLESLSGMDLSAV